MSSTAIVIRAVADVRNPGRLRVQGVLLIASFLSRYHRSVIPAAGANVAHGVFEA